MKKIYLIITVIIYSTIFISNTFGQSNWIWQSPLPTGNNLSKIKFVNEYTGYTVGANFTIAKTTDAGMNWFLINTNFDSVPTGVILNYDISSIFFINSETGFVGGNNLFKTTDGGNRWVYIEEPLNGINSIFFTAENVGYISGTNIAKTTNGGYNWTTLYSGITTPVSYQAVFFPSMDTGYLCTNGSPTYLLKTINGGINWTIVYSNTYNETLAGIDFINNNTGFVCSPNESKIIKTTDGGNLWQSIILPGFLPNPVSVHFTSLNTGYAACELGQFYKTTNSGSNWIQSDLIFMNDVTFSNESTGYIAGIYGKILKTTNSGSNWEMVPRYNDFKILRAVYFTTDKTGFISGDNGTLLKTSNGGLNWINKSINFNYSLTQLKFFNESTGYLSGGIVLKTTDEGNSWDSIAFFNQYNTQFINTNTGFVGAGNIIHKSTDGGNTWNPIPVPIESGTKSFHFLNADICYLSCSSEISIFNHRVRVYKTINGGTSWNLMSNLGAENPITNINFTTEQEGFLNGPGGLFKTQNGGVNWEFMLDDWLPRSPYFYNSNIIYLPTSAGRYYKTTNGGVNWTNQLYIFDAVLNSTFYTSHNTGYIVGHNGVILKTTNGGGIFVSANNINENIPARFSLEQNYPNPFNPVTKIVFSLPQNTDVKLIVYDLLGREVRSIVNEQFSPGKYTYEFDGSDLPSGVYYYKLTTDDFSVTKKMVLLK